ncbi:hypothetical protein CARUB_v10011649mg [Capsella rubella]|uniref:RNase H type-1 domain-containing protein n=1 Tax=Capsella rubella TaxID=81985 RepID=R0II64_9BRAS|nr:hypothetical protein CARUB_v10011649mg [Capsella rubella]
MFLWKCLHGAIPTGQQLVSRHIPANLACDLCGEPESILHLLFHCRFSIDIWALMPFVDPFPSSQVTSVREGLLAVNSRLCLPPLGLTSGPLAPWVCWNIWKTRNQRVFNSRSFSVRETLLKSILDAKEWTFGLSGRAWRSDLKAAGLGWTVTRANGDTSLHSAVCEFVSSPLMAESLACRSVVLDAISLGAEHFLLESDCQQLVGAINARIALPEVHGIISDIFLCISRFSSFVCRFIPRSANGVADSLAKHCLSLYGSNF